MGRIGTYASCIFLGFLLATALISLPVLDAETTSSRGKLPERSEIEYEEGVPIPPMVRPVVILSGSDYEMGYQYYTQLVEIFGKEPCSYEWHPLFAWTRSPMHRGEFTKEELKELGKYEETIRKHTPEMVDFMRGMADGATDAGVPMSYMDILNFYVKRWTYIGSVGKQPYPPMCSGFAAWGSATKDGKLIFGGTGDLEMTVHETTIMAFPATGNNYICNTATGPAYHPGMNNKGLAYVHHGGCRPGPVCNCGHLPKPPYALVMPFSTMHILRFAKDAKEAKEMTMSFPVLSGGVFADIRGNNWCIECTDPPAIRQAGYLGEKDFIYATNNGLCKEVGKEGWKYIPHAGWMGSKGEAGNSITRNVEAWNLFTNYHGNVDLEFAKMIWRFPGTPAAGLEERYLGSKSNSTPSVGIPDNGNNGVFYLATGSPIRSDPVKRGFFRPDNTYAYMQLKLAADPRSAVEASRQEAWNYIHEANAGFSKLKICDPPFAPVEDILNKAMREAIKGSYHFGRVSSGETKGNESICTLAKSLRHFARAQCLAKKAYESLVPSPKSPEDLGLKPWFGDWAKWESPPQKYE